MFKHHHLENTSYHLVVSSYKQTCPCCRMHAGLAAVAAAVTARADGATTPATASNIPRGIGNGNDIIKWNVSAMRDCDYTNMQDLQLAWRWAQCISKQNNIRHIGLRSCFQPALMRQCQQRLLATYPFVFRVRGAHRARANAFKACG